MFGRPAADGGRLQVHFPGGNQVQVPGSKGLVWTHLPSTRRFLVSNSCHLDTDWTSGNRWAGPKVCGTARSVIWVLKGNARTRMLPENLVYLRVGWISRRTYETGWVTPGHDCLCSYSCGHGAAVDHKLMTLSGMGWLVCGAVSPPLVSMVWKRRGANGSEPKPVRWSRIIYSLAQR